MRIDHKTRSLGTIMTALLVFSLCGCSKVGSNIEKGLENSVGKATGAVAEQRVDKKTYRVVSETYFPPFVMLDGKGGVVGFESDLLNAIGELKNVSFEYVTHPWEGIFDTLDTGRNDVVAASVTITPERARKWSFSTPYYASRQTFFSLNMGSTDNPLDNLQGKRVVAKRGTTSDQILKSRDLGLDRIIYLDSVFTGVKEVINKRADGIIGDSGPLKYYASTYAKFSPVARSIPDDPYEFYGFVVSKYRRDDLLRIIDEGLAELKVNGTYDKLYVKWFKENSKPMPTLDDVLSSNFDPAELSTAYETRKPDKNNPASENQRLPVTPVKASPRGSKSDGTSFNA